MSERTGIGVADFLLDRLDEDYETAWGAAGSPRVEDEGGRVLDKYGDVTAVCAYGGTFGHVLHFDPTAMLRRIEATRAAVRRLARVDYSAPSGGLAFGILWELASAYSDHPDYRMEWAA